jgi:hypothetical protein
LSKLRLTQQVGDMLTGIKGRVDAQVFFCDWIAPLDAIHLIQDHYAFGHCRGSAPQTFQGGADLLMALFLFTHDARQARKRISPSSGAVR